MLSAFAPSHDAMVASLSFTEPCGLGARIPASIDAAREVWGEAGAQAALALLDAEARALFTSGAALPEWVPERHFVAWSEALRAGPCGGQLDARFSQWAVSVTDRGFGEARSLFTSLGDPWVVLRRAQELWRGEHSHGTLEFARLDTTAVQLTLREHPFVAHEPTRVGICEALRHIVVTCGGTRATYTREPGDDELSLVIVW